MGAKVQLHGLREERVHWKFEWGRGRYCRVYWPHSMLACRSVLRFRRRKTIFALDFGSESSASD